MRIPSLFLLLCLPVASLASAQEESQEFVDSYNESFLKRPPLIGETVPDVSVWTEKGEPMEFKQTRGKYTVLVFGCLT